MNRFQIIGRLGDNPRRFTENAVSVSLATNRRYRKDNQRIEKTDWNDVVFFDKLAGVVTQYLQKGDTVYVEGQVSRNKYEKNGQVMYSTDLIARNVEFLITRGNGGNIGNQRQQPGYEPPGPGHEQPLPSGPPVDQPERRK